MGRKQLILPKKWNDKELERDRRVAVKRFVDTTMPSWSESYEKWYKAQLPIVDSALKKIRYGLELNVDVLEKDELAVLRFLASPHLSEDNYSTLVETVREEERCNEKEAVLKILWNTIDTFRFPWIESARVPNTAEVDKVVS